MKYIKNYRLFEDSNEYRSNYGDIGAGILPFCSGTGKFLLGYRGQKVSCPYTWAIFGGKLEGNNASLDSIRKCAIREFKEETKFKGHMTLIKAAVYIEKYNEYHNYIGVVEDEFKPRLNWENSKAKWVTLEEMYLIESKHFGLEYLLKESKQLITELAVENSL